MERIAQFIKSISDSSFQNLIIDVRNNFGGDNAVMDKIFSHIAQSPFQSSEYSKVNKQGGFNFFKNCLNYNSDSINLFPDDASINGRNGFYFYNEAQIFPDTLVNFRGKIYLLANERSFSAAVVFAGLVRKHQRGVIVGRETGSTYHQMNALKFVDLRLPNANIDLQIPLVKNVFDCIINVNKPWEAGRLAGLSQFIDIRRVSFQKWRFYSELCQQLIQEGFYLKEPLEESIDKVDVTIYDNHLIKDGFLLLLIISALALLFYKKLQKENNREK